MSQSDIYTVICVLKGEGVAFSVRIEKTEIIDRLKEEIIKKTSAFTNLDTRFLDLYHVDIPDANEVELMASVEAQTLDNPQLPSTSLIMIFPTGPKAETVHFIVKPSKLVTFG